MTLMSRIIRCLIVWICFCCLIFSCSFGQKEKKRQLPYLLSNGDTATELSEAQESALDAFTTLQQSTDTKNRIYSTFAHVFHPCFPPDTSVIITRSQFLQAMTKFGEVHCTQMNSAERDTLIQSAVMARDQYIVSHCASGGLLSLEYETGLPMKGTWVIPSLLGRVDVVLAW